MRHQASTSSADLHKLDQRTRVRAGRARRDQSSLSRCRTALPHAQGAKLATPVDWNVMTDGPLIVQSDRTVLLEVAHPDAADARHDLAVFAELERAPEHIHTYRITRLGLWNARAAGHTAEEIGRASCRERV